VLLTKFHRIVKVQHAKCHLNAELAAFYTTTQNMRTAVN